ncbi:16220_t:CDS:2 [Gigaspora margarita]|uniref:16220_t:CDS:1 n=1 Tax=Gigaspora margarita TaxID=4874 RepID=A0ABN7UKV7_GIGMA|nr:16220_t:CDS:2 [Gigaspora margarita]
MNSFIVKYCGRVTKEKLETVKKNWLDALEKERRLAREKKRGSSKRGAE